ncbi:MAG: acetate/propionate family kinase [Myxococcota bacterium]|nr:acetate/propionate family kinase [Myxococcota bacterium]
MFVLVINCGSSSVKCDIIQVFDGARVGGASAERVGTEACTVTIDDFEAQPIPGAGHATVLQVLVPKIIDQYQVNAVGHRVVHGGAVFDAPILIDDTMISKIEALSSLAPLHNPANVEGILAARACLPMVPHVAVFDTAFHATLPRRAQAYALPAGLVQKHGIRRYGFHGPSHQWVARRAAEWLEDHIDDLRIITCHLGNGASVCAVEYGRSVETSMGMTPLEGLVMGTRCGDIDPGIIVSLMRAEGLDADGVDSLLNRRSGLGGLSGVGHDLRDIEQRAADGDEACRLAIQVFAHRLRKYIGAYAAVMGGVDAIVFTGGIGENSALIRHRVAQRLDFLGAHLDEERNREATVSDEAPVFDIARPNSRNALLVIRTDEARAIAEATAKIVRGHHDVDGQLTIPIAISARHIHLTDEAVEALFGRGHTLTPTKPLSQPGQYACEERLTIIGPKRSIEGVRVLGPTRPKCQVEISRTDEFFIGIDAPVRNSGDVENSPGVTLEGPNGRLTLTEGLICARRHIHMTPDDAQAFGVQDRDVVEVAVDSDGRDLVFGDVLIRVKSTYALEMHVDTDEANAAEIRSGSVGVLSATAATARLRRRRA